MSKIQETEAMKIFKARRASYAPGVSGFMDETELLLMQQHYGELAAREKKPKTNKKTKI